VPPDGASADGASADGASADGASADDEPPDGASLDSASLDGASLDGASLDGASLDGASLDHARNAKEVAVTVHFIGAGPGAPDLLTLRAQRLIGACPVCLYAGALVPAEVLAHAPSGARLIDTQHLTLEQIVAEIVAAHERVQDVARLHSGDLSIFSAAAEQMRRLDRLGIPWDLTPGVPAFAAAAAALRRELTLPNVSQTVILTRHARSATPMPPGEELEALAAHGSTLVLHLAVQAIDEIATTLVEHYGADCPAAVVAYASQPQEQVLQGTLSTIAALVADAGVRRTAVIVVGPALAAEGFCDSHLYSPARERVRVEREMGHAGAERDGSRAQEQ
jgi:precorrin-4/cobalt-precorrin-4 C11-methyltransferase